MQFTLGADCLFELRVPARPESLRLVRAILYRAVELAGCDEKLAEHLVIALNEACMNIIQHAYQGTGSGEFTLQVLADGETLFFCLEDNAAAVDLARVKPRDLDDIRPGGLGVHFIREIMDDYAIGHLQGGGNYLHMKKSIK